MIAMAIRGDLKEQCAQVLNRRFGKQQLRRAQPHLLKQIARFKLVVLEVIKKTPKRLVLPLIEQIESSRVALSNARNQLEIRQAFTLALMDLHGV